MAVDPVRIKLARQEYSLGKYFVGGEISEADGGAVERHGILSAVDVVTGLTVWRHRTGLPLARSGVLATAGRVLFYGDDEGFLNALDERSGDVLRRFDAGVKVDGPPISFTVGGRQRVAAVTRAGLILLSLD